MTHQHGILEATLYFWFAANDTSGSGGDGASAAADVRLAGAAASAAPVLSPTPSLLSHANFPPGCYEVAVAATAANGFAATNTYAIYCTLAIDSQNPTGFIGSFTLDPIIANVKEISDDATAADNLEATYDGTGYTDDDAPAKQSQLAAIANVGAAVNTPAESYTLTTGTQSSGTVSSTSALDGTNHEHTDDAAQMDLYYQFDIGGDGSPTSVSVTGYLNGNNDDLEVYAWNWGGSSWDQIGTLAGKAAATNEVNVYNLFTSHVGTGANLGKVRIRFTDGAFTLTSATLAVDQIFISYAIVRRSVGYADGAIWVDTNASNTNTESYVDGTADNPVSTWAAALTISGNLNITRFHIINGSSITLSANSDNYTLIGDAWTLALGGQSIDSAHFSGAAVTGIGTAVATATPEFHDCTLGAVTLPASILWNCGIGENTGQFTAGSLGEFVFFQCFSMVPGSGSPVLVFTGLGASTGINNRAWKGGATYVLDSDCTLSHEVLAGGITTITTGGADVEIKGITRSLTLTLSAAETAQFVGITGPIILTGTTTATVNLYGVSASLADSTSAATVTDKTVSQANINTEADTALSDYDGPTKAEMDAGHSAIETDTQDIQSRTPAALIAGRTDASIGAIAAAVITAAAIATDAIDADALANNAAIEIADETLKRGVSNVEGAADTTSLTAIILSILESSVSGTTWTIRKTGGTTFVTKTLTVDASADPIIGVT